MFYKKSEEEIEDIITYIKIVFIIFLFISITKIENKINEIKTFGIKPKIRNNDVNFDNNNYNDLNEDISNENDIKYDMNNYINNDMNNGEIKNNMTIKERKELEIEEYKQFLNTKIMPKDKNSPLIKKEKKDILKKFSENMMENIVPNMTIYLDMRFNFGNQLLILNKLIFYCEIIGCKKIILERMNNLYIKNTIYDKEYNIEIEVSDMVNENSMDNADDNNFAHDENINFNDEYDNDNDNDNINVNDNDNQNNINQNIIISHHNNDNNKKDDNEKKKEKIYNLNQLDSCFYFTTYNIRVENKFHIFKNEILKNLPKMQINKEDLYIHIRGSDIFQNRNPDFAPDYGQPPLCFYQKILKTFKFRKIYIISADKENPVVNELLNKNKNIIFRLNTLEIDIASLAYAYNIVGSISSFLISIIKLNNNLKNFWEYDRYLVRLGIPHLHHSLYNFTRKYTIYRMKPSKIYKNQMIIWQGSNDQLKIMLNDTCTNNFTVIKPNI